MTTRDFPKSAGWIPLMDATIGMTRLLHGRTRGVSPDGKTILRARRMDSQANQGLGTQNKYHSALPPSPLSLGLVLYVDVATAYVVVGSVFVTLH